MVDIDDTIIEVHGYSKQGSGYGYSGVRGLNALLAIKTYVRSIYQKIGVARRSQAVLGTSTSTRHGYLARPGRWLLEGHGGAADALVVLEGRCCLGDPGDLGGELRDAALGEPVDAEVPVFDPPRHQAGDGAVVCCVRRSEGSAVPLTSVFDEHADAVGHGSTPRGGGAGLLLGSGGPFAWGFS